MAEPAADTGRRRVRYYRFTPDGLALARHETARTAEPVAS